MENQLLRRHQTHAVRQSLRRQLLRERYLLKDAQGRVVETPRQMFMRVAKAIAAAQADYGATRSEVRALAKEFYRLMRHGIFLPNSPTLMNAGRENGMCNACFVLPVEDSIDGIFAAITQTAQIQKAGGGTGFAFDKLRPTGDYVASSGGQTSGPISFWRVFAETTHAIQQGAHRRGANMAMASIEHPDILKFIRAKSRFDAFENFNVSIKITNDFMDRLRNWPDSPHIVINPRNGSCHMIPKSVTIETYRIQDLPAAGAADVPCYSVQNIWEMIVTSAHATGEPGVCFIDRVNEDNPTPSLGRIEATNPCGEQPLLPNESCNLGSINLAKFIIPCTGEMDWDELARTVRLAVRFLDNVADVTYYPTEKIRARSQGNRKIGLGVMGFADAMVLSGLRYDSQEALDFASEVSAFLQRQAHDASLELTNERGSFPNWIGSTWYTQHKRPMRNAAVTTIAPTGSISIIAGCSSGIEPIYMLAYRRRALDGQGFIQVHPLLGRIGCREGWMTDAVRDALLDGTPATQIEAIPKPLAEALVTAHEVAPEWHVRMQAAFQEHVDNAVSKTVNLPENAVAADVDSIFRMAFELRCKGITVYRDGSRQGQTFSTADGTKKPATPNGTTPRPRSRVTSRQTFKARVGCGTIFTTVNRDDEGLAEVFAVLGKMGGCPSQSEATCRAVSAALRCGVDPAVLIEQLKGIHCLSTCVARKDNKNIVVLSCPDAIARAIQEAMGVHTDVPAGVILNPCPECGQALRKEAGCLVCANCGYTKCG